MAATPCRAGGRFSRCPDLSQHSCQYCGRGFCANHGYFVEADEAVCSRRHCRARHDDLVRHLLYLERAGQLNRVGLCGLEGCNRPHQFQCSLCRAHFCESHLAERRYPFSEGWSRVERWVSVCADCWNRRKVWQAR
ncbi:MAG: hypothetical protein KJ053_02570 [Dehalococcoidia bacterium]|nr:hypothetical protein [Dehalococcoidia bacterium]